MSSSSRDVLSRLDPRVPDRLIGRRPPGGAVSAAQPAATVALLRDRPVRTYLMHRHTRMPFAAGMVVFPGGRVDPVDHHNDARRPAGDSDHPSQQTFRQCAVREVAEETGVRLDPAALHPWAHWITPEHEPRRYDTYFYLAAVPDDQEAENISGEADRAEWQRPFEVLAAADRGELALMPPTRSVLLELRSFDDVGSVLAAAADRRVETVLPRLVQRPSGWEFDYGVRDNEGSD